jgi:hypothetical protein
LRDAHEPFEDLAGFILNSSCYDGGEIKTEAADQGKEQDDGGSDAREQRFGGLRVLVARPFIMCPYSEIVAIHMRLYILSAGLEMAIAMAKRIGVGARANVVPDPLIPI